ncbi:Rossmann-fold NAD(P)-binding domain-containing protein [Geminicoccus flavidas]|uniref:SDR family NAD(P)-dependent oxidoreductase n=1 Tax=Geminicoccus flavidas TaxID=2506407 RepID=UPI00190F0D6B|nr:SDR family NAD(P)-dependent oxidoreductase [Geminicoccus flavidas]
MLAVAIRSDQAEPSPAPSLIHAVAAEFGRLDILVNNLSIAVQGVRVGDPKANADGLDRQWHINVLGVVAATVCFLAGPNAGYIIGGILDIAGGYQI